MVDKLLEGKVAVVTGSGRGIGRGVAIALAEYGAKVVVNDVGVSVEGTDTTSRPADDVVAEIKSRGGVAVPNFDSVVTMDGGKNIIQTALGNFGTVDILITPAGIIADNSVFEMTEEEWDAVISVHLKGTFTVVKYASTVMREQRGGRIMLFSSTAGFWGNRGQANYAAAKDGVAGFGRALAQELREYGITVNCISPGAATRMTAAVSKPAQELPADQAAEFVPRQLAKPPEAIAPLLVWLASDEAANVTGQILHITGGIVGLMSQPSPARTITQQDGPWTVEDIAALFPTTLGMDLSPQILWAGWRPGIPVPPGTWGRGWR